MTLKAYQLQSQALAKARKQIQLISFVEAALLKITILSLENAELSKEEFIHKMASEHGYDFENLFKQHYRIGNWKALIFLMSLPGINTWIQSHYHDPSSIIAYDLRLVAKLISDLIGG